jgi:SNF2 family DNA or RNA helicase
MPNKIVLLQKDEIRNMIEEDGSAKGIVFSQFTSFLDLIGYSLNMVKGKNNNNKRTITSNIL